MRVRELIDYLETYDDSEEVQVEAAFLECGEIFSQTFDVTTFSHEELEGGEANPFPTISAGIGFGVLTEDDMEELIGFFKGIERRLRYNRGEEGV